MKPPKELDAIADKVLAYIKELEAALKAVEPHLDAIVCYASTMTEHDGNRIAKQVRDLLGGK